MPRSDYRRAFKIERWKDCREELAPLWKAYADEAEIEVEPDDQVYEWLEDDIILATMRGYGELVGAHRSIIGPDLHRAGETCAFCDGWFVLPEWRQGRAAFHLLWLAEDEARKRGCASICQSSSPHRPIDNLLDREGWTRSETLYRKRL